MNKQEVLIVTENKNFTFEECLRQNGRIQKLRAIERFSDEPYMIHRTNLLTHTTRVQHLALNIAKVLNRKGIIVDMQRVEHLADIHDDPEIITGDINSKRKLNMTQEERSDLKKAERKAAVALSILFMPSEFQELYMIYYDEMSEKETIEAQVVDIADKWDAICEVIREIKSGNYLFIDVLKNYREDIFPHLMRHSIWQTVNSETDFQLGGILIDDPFPSFYEQWVDISHRSSGTHGYVKR